MSRWFSKIGPGTLIAAAFIGPGTVTVCMLAGVNHGFDLLWAMVFFNYRHHCFAGDVSEDRVGYE